VVVVVVVVGCGAWVVVVLLVGGTVVVGAILVTVVDVVDVGEVGTVVVAVGTDTGPAVVVTEVVGVTTAGTVVLAERATAAWGRMVSAPAGGGPPETTNPAGTSATAVAMAAPIRLGVPERGALEPFLCTSCF
jgi:hypothetical protein